MKRFFAPNSLMQQPSVRLSEEFYLARNSTTWFQLAMARVAISINDLRGSR